MAEETAIERRIRTLEDEIKRNQTAHKEFYDRFETMGKEYTRIDSQYSYIVTALSEMKVSIDELKSKPSKRWEMVVSSVLQWVVVAALAAMLLAK